MPRLGLSLAVSTEGASSKTSPSGIVGFPLRLRMFNGATSVNLYRITNNANLVEYISDNEVYYALWAFGSNLGELFENSTLFSGPTLGSAPTNWPTTGWAGGWQFGVASPTLVTLSYASPQSFAYSNSVPSIVLTSSPAINANLFTISGLSSSNVGTQYAVISLEKADYYLANSVTIPVAITKRNVTLSINNQSSTYSPNATYNWFSAVGVSTLAAGDTIQGRFNSDLLTGVPAANANAGSYTISFNPNYTSQNYNITNSPASATWTINKASQTITFNPSGTALTTDTTNLSASSTSGLTVSFSVVSGPGSINGSTLTYSGAGSVVVRASQAGNGNYNPATNVDRTITVSAPQASGIPVSSTLGFSWGGHTWIKSTNQNFNDVTPGTFFYRRDNTNISENPGTNHFIFFWSGPNGPVNTWVQAYTATEFIDDGDDQGIYSITNYDLNSNFFPSGLSYNSAGISATTLPATLNGTPVVAGIPTETTEQISVNGSTYYRAGSSPNYYYTDNDINTFQWWPSMGWYIQSSGDSVYYYESGLGNPYLMPTSFTGGGVTFNITRIA